MRVASALLLLFSTLLVLSGGRDARAAIPTTVVLRNPGTQSSRVQLAIGSTMPCDSSADRLVFDEVLEPGAVRMLAVDSVVACARNTSAGSTIEWRTTQIVYGGVRCRKDRACWPDPNVPMEYAVIF